MKNSIIIATMDALRIQAFAKINIGLKIFAKKPTGYHDIEGIFQNVSVSDTLIFEKNGTQKIEIRGDIGCPVAESSIYKAILEFDAFFKGKVHAEGILVDVSKGIPSGAGLGGASADAAATLVALNRLFHTKMTKLEIAQLALRVGSDVPFFVLGGAAIVRGRGEQIIPIIPRFDFGMLIIQPPWISKTSAAYQNLDVFRQNNRKERYAQEDEGLERAFSAYQLDQDLIAEYEAPLSRWNFNNDFEAILMEEYPGYREIFILLQKSGAVFSAMTGSGSCLYSVFENLREAKSAASKFKALVLQGSKEQIALIKRIFIARPLARSMKIGYIHNYSEDTRSDKERPCYGSN